MLLHVGQEEIMIKITCGEQASQITNDQISEVDFDSLLETFRREEYLKEPKGLFTVLLCKMVGWQRQKKRDFSFSWVIENVGNPHYFAKNDKGDWDLYYVYEGKDGVGCIDIRASKLDGFGTIDWKQFEENVIARVEKWDEAQHKPGP